jgi:hypothetical protein
MTPDEIAKCIPEEVVQVIRKACDSGEPWNIRDTLAAALAAWKAAEQTELCGGRSGPALILPLQETKVIQALPPHDERASPDHRGDE